MLCEGRGVWRGKKGEGEGEGDGDGDGETAKLKALWGATKVERCEWKHKALMDGPNGGFWLGSPS